VKYLHHDIDIEVAVWLQLNFAEFYTVNVVIGRQIAKLALKPTI
jgi:hypothetical protein